MNAVLSIKRPILPVEYDTAIKALSACLTLDEAKYWDDKADALAAWAKIYSSDEAEQKARCLKLYAYRRMGEIAQELRPSKVGRPTSNSPGTASELLGAHGLSGPSVRAAKKLAALPQQVFEAALRNPRAPTTIANRIASKEPIWREFCQYAMGLRGFSSRVDVTEIATVCRANERYKRTADELLRDLRAFLDALERGISK